MAVDGVTIVICNTMVKHELATGEYNTRRAECEEGVRVLAGKLRSVRTLRDVSVADLERHGAALSETVRQRCRHVVSENARVEAARDALRAGDLAGLGEAMAASHRSLRDDYAVSCAELDLMVELAARAPGLRAARMTGGGFGGCTINLVDAAAVEPFCEALADGYQRSTGRAPEILICEAAGGAERAA